MKIITICGSLKFKNEMIKQAIKLQLEGNCVLMPIIPIDEKLNYTKEELELLKKAHFQRIDISDSIFVVNIGGYIGESTIKEIDHVTKQNKKILYLEKMGGNLSK